jgi:hypothetical protein
VGSDARRIGGHPQSQAQQRPDREQHDRRHRPRR